MRLKEYTKHSQDTAKNGLYISKCMVDDEEVLLIDLVNVLKKVIVQTMTMNYDDLSSDIAFC